MAFTAGSVELARAQRLGQKLFNLNNTFGLTTGGYTSGTSGRDVQFIEKLARNGRFTVTGFTTGNGFPPFLTNDYFGTGLARSNNASTNALGITLGANTGFTLGVVYKTLIASGNSYSGNTIVSGFTFAQTLYGVTGSISILTGGVS